MPQYHDHTYADGYRDGYGYRDGEGPNYRDGGTGNRGASSRGLSDLKIEQELVHLCGTKSNAMTGSPRASGSNSDLHAMLSAGFRIVEIVPLKDSAGNAYAIMERVTIPNP